MVMVIYLFFQVCISELETTLDKERKSHESALAALQSELDRLRDQMGVQMILDIRTAERNEHIEVDRIRCLPFTDSTVFFQFYLLLIYRLTPTSESGPDQDGSLSRRTRSTMLEEPSSYSLPDFVTTSIANGDVEVFEVDPKGDFIRLLNKGEKVTEPFSNNFDFPIFKIIKWFILFFKQEVGLSGWQLVHRANETVTIFKFHRSVKIAPGATVTVWSNGKQLDI